MVRFSAAHAAFGFAVGLILGWVVGSEAFASHQSGGAFALAVGAVTGLSVGLRGHRSKADQQTGEQYDLSAFAARYKLSERDARRIMRKYGSSRQALDAYMAARVGE